MWPLKAFMRHILKARVFFFRAQSFVKSSNVCYKPFIKYSDYFHQFRQHRASYLGYSFYPLYACGIGMLFVGAPTTDQEKELFKAAQYGNVADIMRLCGKGPEKVNPNVRHTFGWTPIMVAAANGQAEAVEALISCGADMDLQDLYQNPQKTAIKLKLRSLDVLVTREDEFSESLNGRANYSGFTALHYCALSDSEAVVRLLMAKEANPMLQDNAGRRALDYARQGSTIHSLLTKYTAKMEVVLKDRQAEERRRFPLEQRLKQFIVGQQGAINTVSASIRRKENGWADDEHPLVFLFLGSSGIGKTELAKRLANYIHKDNPEGFIRLDMSEYQDKHEVAKLIGAPPGYIGHDDGGQLTHHLAKQKDAVVLFDEVDKAHPDVLTALLQLFDEGRLTDGKGALIECKDAIFVMTSNLASEEIAEHGMELRREAEIELKKKLQSKLSSGETNQEENDEIAVSRHFKDNIIRPILKSHFGRDEFLGRINEIVYFLPFSRQELLTLVTMELNLWAKKAKTRHSIDLTWENGVLGALADGYDVHYGARSIKYEVERRVVNKIALASERGMLGKGSKILVTCSDLGVIDVKVKKKGELKFTIVV